MLDLSWERTIPIQSMQLDAIAAIMAAFDKSIEVTGWSAVRIGCKNSNFAVYTNKGMFLLRMTDKQGFNNEAAVHELVKSRVRVPALLYQAIWNHAGVFLYEFVQGVSLQRRIIRENRCAPNLLQQVAEAAAIIHSIPEHDTAHLAKLDVPPYAVWYQVFLEHPTTKRKMGDQLLARTHRLVSDKAAFLSVVDSHQTLIHNDFRPANMLVDRHDRVWFVDWEGAWRGHSLADIGQFFRYRAFFQDAACQAFAQAYNAVSGIPLPQDWLDLSLFRDLVNLLQLLSINQVAPQRDADLLRILEGTLQHFGY